MSFSVVSTHWVGYVCITYSSYLQHLTKRKEKKRKTNKTERKEERKERPVKKAPLEVRHTKGGSLKSASGILRLLKT